METAQVIIFENSFYLDAETSKGHQRVDRCPDYVLGGVLGRVGCCELLGFRQPGLYILRLYTPSFSNSQVSHPEISNLR